MPDYNEFIAMFHHHYWIFPFLLKLLGLFTAYFVICRLRPKLRSTAIFIVVILIGRVVLFENPKAWQFYRSHLTAGDIGWRQKDVLLYENKKYQTERESVQYLVVGSSQAGAVFKTNDRTVPALKIFSLAGFGPLDFYVYRKYIVGYHPEAILLYLSDFDMGRKPSILGSKLGPNQRWGLVGINAVIRKQFPHDDEIKKELKEWVVGEVFTEYKYAFIFKGLVQKFFNKAKAYPEVNALTITDTEYQKKHLQNLLNHLDLENIDINVYFLTRFLNCIAEENIKVYIIEGHYHPEAYTKNTRINRKAIGALEALSDKYNSVAFIPKSRLIEFGEDDYRDGYHVNENAAARFTHNLFDTVISTESFKL